MAANRPPRLLWACPYCLLDTSSGCSMSVRELLRQLKNRGFDVYILSSTIFDREAGTLLLRENWNVLQERCQISLNYLALPIKGKILDLESCSFFYWNGKRNIQSMEAPPLKRGFQYANTDSTYSTESTRVQKWHFIK